MSRNGADHQAIRRAARSAPTGSRARAVGGRRVSVRRSTSITVDDGRRWLVSHPPAVTAKRVAGWVGHDNANDREGSD